jgi:hypothetical protein
MHASVRGGGDAESTPNSRTQATHGEPTNAIWFQSSVNIENPKPLWYLHTLTLAFRIFAK